MEPNQFRKYRVLFIRQGCQFCRRYLEFIERINSKLPIDKRIKFIDCSMMKYGIVSDNLINLFDKQIDGYPCLFLSGIKISGINSAIEAKSFLESYLDKEFIIPEENKFMFSGDCSFKKSGLFKNQVVCK